MKIRWYGTASVSVETADGAVLFDPFVPFPGSPVRTTAADYDGFRDIVVTHAHIDHIGSIPELFSRRPREIYGTDAVFRALTRLGIPAEHIHGIRPGDEFTLGGVRLTVYRSRHIRYDAKLLAGTLLNPRMVKYARNFGKMGRLNAICRERGETVGFRVAAEGKSVFLLGSLNLDGGTEYPQGMDALLLPYQGTSDLLTPALAVAERLKPQCILLDHWDDTFPPLSRTVETADIEAALRGRIGVRKPGYGESGGLCV